MSDFTVLRSLDGYCLVLDKKRIAGGKPDYRGENVLVDWTTEVAYGPVDDLAAENAKLRDALDFCLAYVPKCDECAAMLDCDECLRADADHKARKALAYENAKLRQAFNETHDDVWQFIDENGIEYNPLYDEGWKRVGCVGCPMGNRARLEQFRRWPQYEAAYKRAFAKMLDVRRSCGMDTQWSDADDVFRWWMEVDA